MPCRRFFILGVMIRRGFIHETMAKRYDGKGTADRKENLLASSFETAWSLSSGRASRGPAGASSG